MLSMRMSGSALLAVALLSLVPQSSAQSLATLYASDNGGSAGGAVFFDVNVLAPGGLIIESIDTNTSAVVGNAVSALLYTVPTTFLGNETNMAAWTLMSSGTGVSAGTDVPTPIDLTDFVLPAGQWGVALVLNDANGTMPSAHRYTGTGSGGAGMNFANAEMSITTGAALNVPWTGSPFNPRSWNGEIYYSPNQNILSITQSGAGVGDLDARIARLSATAAEGWTLLSGNTSLPLGTGYLLGLNPDGLTWGGFSQPLIAGSPFHFDARISGVFPQAPFIVGPGSVSGLAGQTLDFVCLFLDANGGFDGASNVVRVTFQ